MGLFNSLYTGASGMLAQTRSTENISENIANTATVGYKRSDVSFNDLLQTQSRYSRNISGGVRGTEVQRVDQQGAIQQTTSTTNVSIAGNGLFIVRPNGDGVGELYFTRAGQFSPDAGGILRNTAGFVLYGYRTDTDGNAVGSGESGLVAVDLDAFDSAYYETSRIDASINIDSEEDAFDPHNLGTGQQLPLTGAGFDYSRSLTVYDSNGDSHNMRFEFRRTIGPMAHFTSNSVQDLERDNILVDDLSGPTPSITNGDQMVISDGTNTLAVDFVNTTADTSLNQAQTVEDMMDVINSFTNGAGEPVFLARLSSNNQLTVQAHNPTVTLDISGSSANVLAAGGFNFIQDPDGADYTYEPDYNITAPGAATAYPGQSDLPGFANTTSPNPYNWWEMTLVTQDDMGADVVVSQGLLNFNGDGSLNAVEDADGQSIMTINSGDLPFPSTTNISMNLSQITQLSGEYQTIELAQNGAPVGTRRSVEIRNNGMVYVNFTNDISLPAYLIPLAMFNNPNGLEHVDGTAFRIPADGSSGEVSIETAGTNGSGNINGSTLESSNVDIANEFGDLIVSQRVYSLNSQVIQAVNEMTQNLSQLKG
jgi:flagellar hook protein FlgE